MHVIQSSARHQWGHLIVLLAIIVSLLPDAVAATDQAPIVSLGESNTQLQRHEVLDILGASSSERVVTVTVDETVQSMEGVFDVSRIKTAYSSTALACPPTEGADIAVRTRNIELIPPELYALALLTAGMNDVQLAVAAPNDAPALGMTAMTGVFKTWDLASCSGSDSDPLRRQLALEQLALIAEIGQEPGAVRRTTLVVLEAQQEITGTQVTTAQLDVIVASRSKAAGVDLRDEDQAAIVAFLADLSGAGFDWGEFTDGWSMQYADDGSSVVLKAHDKALMGSGSDQTIPARIGGVTGPIAVAASPIASASPTVVDSVLTTATSAPTPTVGHDSTTTFMSMVTEHGRDGRDRVLRWWPQAVVLGALLLLGIGARRQPSETPTTWYDSWTRNFWLGRTLRRPPIVQSPRRRRGHVIVNIKQ